ncbi:DUF1254 domain-containing protein [Rhizobium sp. CSW-27]|uniref:DUF1254 domain-containing protein n=1 Tax=Rhizobium sp. CSW-27 TaxID=2839985 RepID=UPI001C01AFCB|nr:DUF1254 domain-containing protein [Rhizobium sp. CSW-27]MBT9368621.1 DUF1254 domain-containing protein [Rhizobium sp. CSW-27]
MLKILLAILTGLVGAALLHLVIILALPYYSERDAYSRVLGEGQPFRFHSLGASRDAAGLSRNDPFLDLAVCAFDLDENPVRLTASGAVPFWSLATFDSASNETFSINDRTSVGGTLDVILATPLQATRLRKALPAALDQSIIVETSAPQGYAVLRAMAPQASFRPGALQFLAQATCSPMEMSAN